MVWTGLTRSTRWSPVDVYDQKAYCSRAAGHFLFARLTKASFRRLANKKSPPLCGELFAVWTGLEPATPCVTGRYSNQLNYQTSVLRCANIIVRILLQIIFLNI